MNMFTLSRHYFPIQRGKRAGVFALNLVDQCEPLSIQPDTMATLFGNMRAGVFRTVGALSDARTSRHAPQYRGWPCPLVR